MLLKLALIGARLCIQTFLRLLLWAQRVKSAFGADRVLVAIDGYQLGNVQYGKSGNQQ